MLAANINIDGLAFMETFRDLVGIGGELSDLGRALERAAGSVGFSVTPAESVMWSHEAFQRSDQAAFAEVGVPSLLVNEGFRWTESSVAEATHRMWRWFETRYHTPADDLDQALDFAAARDHCRVVLALIWGVADSKNMPQWNPGTPYAYTRLLSLADQRN
jgi:Zn-dependent M28 family amino/carboxypeptidase